MRRPGRVQLRPLRYRGLTLRQHVVYRRHVRPHVDRALAVWVVARSAPGVLRSAFGRATRRRG